MTRLEALALRRGPLLARAQQDRARISHSLAPFAAAIGVADRGWALVRWLRERPLLVAGAVALAIVARPKGSLRLVRFGIAAWQGWRWASALLQAASRRTHR